MKPSKTKKTVYSIIAIIMALAIATIAASFYFINYALGPYNRSHDEAMQRFYKREPASLKAWVDSLVTTGALHDTSIVVDGRGKLSALYLTGSTPTNRVAVLLHGYNDRAESMLHIAHIYNHDLGYNVLMPHFFAHGESDGDHIDMGWLDHLDMMRWMQVANEKFRGDSAQSQQVVHGISMGGFTTMCISGEQCPSYVKCFVEDCGYTSVWDEFSAQLSEQFSLPDFPIMHTTSLLCQLRYGWSFSEASAIEQLKKSRLPMLFIHGDRDTFVPYAMLDELYAAKTHGYKEKYVAHGTEHARAYTDHTAEYTRRVTAFVGRFIK